jgi:hypothetical protein
LDEEHGVNRDRMREDFEELDKMYRVSEKQELAKYKQIGKSAQDYYDESQSNKVGAKGNTLRPTEESTTTKTDNGLLITRERVEDGQMEVSVIKGENFE